MSRRENTVEAAVGFLTVVDSEPHGLLGGYLVLSALGRPLEFHCTAPVRANRAQEILYGPTLAPYLYGEQIGRTLLAAAKADVPLVCTDLRAVLAVADLARPPVVLVLSPDDGAANGTDDVARRHDGPHAIARPHAATFNAGRFPLALAAGRESDRDRVLAAVARLGGDFDLQEPFGRIREAIAEAQRGANQ